MLLCSLRLLPRTFSQMFTAYFHVSSHKCSFPHVSCPEHSQMFTKFISTCVLPRTFTNVHKVYFHMSLAQNIHKCSQSLFSRVLPRTFAHVHKVYFHMCMSCPEHSQMFTKSISMCLAQNIHKCSQSLYFHVSCPEHSQMFTNLHMSLAKNMHPQN